MAQLNIRLDDSLKEQAEALFNRMGLTMSAAAVDSALPKAPWSADFRFPSERVILGL
ncbi:MAG: hypothetical protein LBF87_07705 [Treponema sp.]|jgi:Arc/MetJ family transcription regulator|nr:hypothetical protein [Treponema sp.]